MRCCSILSLVIPCCVIVAVELRAGVIDDQPTAATATTKGATTQTVLAPAVRSGAAATRAATPATTGPTTNATRLKFPTWGIELTPPAGWTRMPESDFTVLAQWAPSDGSPGLFRILFTPLIGRSVRDVADSLAKGLQATIEETTLDGRPAKRVKGGADGTSEVLCQREGYLIEIRCHHASALGKIDELENMRKSWHWTEVEAPAKHPELRADPTPLSDQITVQMPTDFRSWPIPPTPKGTVRYAAVDCTRQRIRREFDVEFSIPDNIQGQPLDKLATALSVPYQEDLRMTRPIGWRLVEGTDDRIISQQILGQRPVENPNGPPAYAKCLGVVALDNHTRLLAVFTCVTDSDDDRFAYMSMAESIMTTVRKTATLSIAPAPPPSQSAPVPPPVPAPTPR